VIFVAGLSLGWYAQRFAGSPSRQAGSPLSWVPVPPGQPRTPLPEYAPRTADAADDLAALLEQDAFAAALQGYEALQAGADEAALERAGAQILSRARALLGSSRYAAAEQLLQGYLLADHRDVEARMLLADAYAGRKEYQAAIDELYQARGDAWQPDSLERLARRIGAVVAEQVNVLRQASDQGGLLELYQRLTQLDPSYAPYFLGLANAQLALDDHEAARRSLQLVAQDPDVGTLARAVLEQLGRAEVSGDDPDASAALTGVTGVPLHRSGNHFLVDARLGGAGSVRLLIDTGASMTILTPGALAGNGGYRDTGHSGLFSTANGKVRAPVYTLDALEVGDWQVSELDIGVLELDDGAHIDGLLGMNFLRHFQFFIDQDQALLRLSAPNQ
jgi:clan AA aspartic protease (TIGR02281 family)